MKNGQLQILVCSANLGNAQPDEESMALWLPEDGQCNQVLQYPAKYPVRDQFSTFEDFVDEDKFDLIVVGMQEATFDPPTEEDLNDKDAASTESGTQSKRKPRKGKKGIAKAVNDLSSYTASRDHIKSSMVRRSVVDRMGETGRPNLADVQGKESGQTGESAMIAAVVDSNWDLGTFVLHEMMTKRLPSYERIVSYQRGQMRLEIFVYHQKRDIEVDVMYTKAQNTGRAGLANKGGIIAELIVNKRTRLSFLTAHLEAHEGAAKYQMRCSSLSDILGGAKPSSTLHDASLTSHHCFVMGDLNFRTELPAYAHGHHEAEHRQKLRALVEERDWNTLNQADELQKALRVKDCLVGFKTLFCNFPPTFKVERSPGYSYIEKRRPSYTDRILWKSNHLLENSVRPLLYEPVDDFKSSDHKPIRAAFAIKLNEAAATARPKMARRRSAMQMAGDFLHMNHNPLAHSSIHRERLYLFVSDVTVNMGAVGNSLPNPYISMVSIPEEAIKSSTSRLERLKRKIFPCFSNYSSIMSDEWGGPVERTPQGWPHSPVQKQTAQPLWEGEVFHTEVKTFYNDGRPLDMTGALVFFTVMDCKNSKLVPSASDNVLGSFSYNLGVLLKDFRPPGELRQNQANASERRTSRRGSIMNLFRRDESSQQFTADSRKTDNQPLHEQDPVKTITVDAPIFKNGLENGRIRLTLDAWWLTESTAKAILGTSGSASTIQRPSNSSPAESARMSGRMDAPQTKRRMGGDSNLGASHTFSTRRDPNMVKSTKFSKSTSLR
ncbi:hypothetical protein FisN_21Lh191 [Fistulifera solaris]|uniref:Inositol polyphosphate-related phosphatase domain-containing protein n=1 Tax=Fistulifera solaris TaxID=1519565 RepID=A0A1Z5J926_FISSO|nr:hypothetical protein FisN_21Lh191 [Fistulifera solaris]|eukprot:GAX10490.1 hypothetical protein FisN_21Lh191 [Fistulifera solaris]